SDSWSPLAVNTVEFQELQYPYAFVLPNGKLFAWDTQGGKSRILDVNAQTWTQAAPDSSIVTNGTAVMYRPGKVLVTGGSHDGTSETAAAVLDMTQATPAWTQVAPMAFGREYHSMVSLPDGKVLIVGGSPNHDLTNTQPGPLTAELWDPSSQTFTTLAA